MNKEELIEAVAGQTGISRSECKRTINATLSAITNAMAAGEEVRLVGFGIFDTKEKPDRTVRNPRSGAPVQLEACRIPIFRPSIHLRESVH